MHVGRGRFTPTHAVIGLVLIGLFFASGYAYRNFERYGLVNLFAVLACFVLIITELILLAVRIVRRRWRSSLSAAIAPGLLVIVFFARSEIFFVIDFARFLMFRDYYTSVLIPAASASPVRSSLLDWGFSGHFLTSTVYRKLAYDATDQVDRLDAQRSEQALDFVQAVVEHPLSRCNTNARRIEGHFYLVEVIC
jgi:hypothetical protein